MPLLCLQPPPSHHRHLSNLVATLALSVLSTLLDCDGYFLGTPLALELLHRERGKFNSCLLFKFRLRSVLKFFVTDFSTLIHSRHGYARFSKLQDRHRNWQVTQTLQSLDKVCWLFETVSICQVIDLFRRFLDSIKPLNSEEQDRQSEMSERRRSRRAATGVGNCNS